MDKNNVEKTITGYCEPLSLAAGELISLRASSEQAVPAELSLVRIVCGDPTRFGGGFREVEIKSDLPAAVQLDKQALIPGSFGRVDLGDLQLNSRFELDIHVRPSCIESDQIILTLACGGDALCLSTQGGRFAFGTSQAQQTINPSPVVNGRWYRLKISASFAGDGELIASVASLATRSPGNDFQQTPDPSVRDFSAALRVPERLDYCLFAAGPNGERFDGRLARVRMQFDDVALSWDFAAAIGAREIPEASQARRNCQLFQLPASGVTGPDWDGSEHAWPHRPAHYDAVHFHSDDLYDAGWSETAQLALPSDLPSGIYAFRLRAGEAEDRIPFFVRPGPGTPTADVALLMPTCTYMAYANHRMLLDGADFVAARNRLRPEHEYLRDHPEVGSSLYEKHSDGSGVMFSSRRRPVLQLRPGADGWNFTPDTNINAFLEHLQLGHDIIADEDIHHDGLAALAPYRVLVTGTHPEYWSSDMLAALEQWLRDGGRLMYLGGNGFYWRVAFSEQWPGAIELRRAEDGVRNWQCEVGESYHAFNGEYGGLWRRLGCPPNALVGVGFAAQGFEQAIGYQRSEASYNSRAAWIFDGVEASDIGTSGLGGGAAGQEIDSFNADLGSPAHAVILASATEFGADMTRTKEELDAAIIVPEPDPVVRSDVVFFETPAGGAVFSVGSISWFGALARDGYDNDIAQITENVIRRFLDPQAFSAE